MNLQPRNRREAQFIQTYRPTPTDDDIFQPNEAGHIATHIAVALECPYCGLNLRGEHIKLLQFKPGMGLIFHTDNGHQLSYRGRNLRQLDCDRPITARVTT